MVSSLSSGSSKRSRAMRSGNSIASCLVDGCVSDLSRCREYHRRHKVCEVHSKTATVMVGGRVQRFCQQCSRFHLLVEFDDVKRSCRKRLEGHNRRRRKPQLRSLNFGSYVTDQQGAEFTSYPQAFSTTSPKSNWTPFVKVEDILLNSHSSAHHHLPNEYVNKEHFPVSSHGIIYKDDKKFPLVQENVFTSDCVRSLLSSPKAQNVACSGYGNSNPQLSSPKAQNVACSGYGNSNPQPLITTVKYDGVLNCQTWRENLGIVSISECNAVDFNCGGLFHAEGEGSSDGDPQGLPFSWQ